MPAPDAMLFDFSDSEWHFGLEGAARMANAYPKTPLLLHHWGCVDAPDFAPFNGDPRVASRQGREPRALSRPSPGSTLRTPPSDVVGVLDPTTTLGPVEARMMT
jgi:hypothetical protein